MLTFFRSQTVQAVARRKMMSLQMACSSIRTRMANGLSALPFHPDWKPTRQGRRPRRGRPKGRPSGVEGLQFLHSRSKKSFLLEGRLLSAGGSFFGKFRNFASPKTPRKEVLPSSGVACRVIRRLASTSISATPGRQVRHALASAVFIVAAVRGSARLAPFSRPLNGPNEYRWPLMRHSSGAECPPSLS